MDSRIANNATKAAATDTTMIAAMAQAALSDSSASVVGASAAHNKIFIAYMVFLVGVAIGTLAFTYWVWKSGNAVQDAIRKDADARIAEAAVFATKANERAGILETEMLGLRIKADEQQERAAVAERELVSVKAGLSAQQEKTAKAFLGIRDAMKPRRIPSGVPRADTERRERWDEVAKYAGTRAVIFVVVDPEAQKLAFDIANVVTGCGWKAETRPLNPAAMPIGGVWLVTREESPTFDAETRRVGVPATSREGLAAQALVSLLTSYLGPPHGDELGVLWHPEYEYPGKKHWDAPAGTVAILVGERQIEFMLPTFSDDAAETGDASSAKE